MIQADVEVSTSTAIAQRQRRRSSSRGPRRCSKIDSNELHELLLASELVPSAHNRPATKPQQRDLHQFDDASTAAPSAEQSPELACLDGSAGGWPSLPAEDCWSTGWNVCTSDDTSLTLPEPAVPLDEAKTENDETSSTSLWQSIKSWMLVPESRFEATAAVSETVDKAGKMTFADVVRSKKKYDNPPACGFRMPATQMQLPRRGGRSFDEETEDYSEDLEVMFARRHGWKREHKASWNTKQNRKVVDRKLQRLNQKNRQKAINDEKDDQEEEIL